MTGDKNLPALFVHQNIHTSLLRRCKDLQARDLFDILSVNGGMPGMGNPEFIVKATKQDSTLIVGLVRINTEELFRQLFFVDAIMVIKTSLGSPANMESRVDMGLAPLHNGTQLLPVVHILKFQMFHRRSSDDHTVKLTILQFIKGFVKRQQMLLGSVL